MDNSNNANILRYPVGAETWQARHDVTVGETTYEGWLTDEASTEVTDGINARMDKVTFGKLGPMDMNVLTIQPGYVTRYKEVEITDGIAKMNLLFLDLIYFLKNDKTLEISYSADKRLVGRMGINFDAEKSLGKPYYVTCGMPIGNSYSAIDIERAIKSNGFNELETKINYIGNESWMSAQELLKALQNPASDHLDLIFKITVDQILP